MDRFCFIKGAERVFFYVCLICLRRVGCGCFIEFFIIELKYNFEICKFDEFYYFIGYKK